MSGKGNVRGWKNDRWSTAFRTLPLRTWDTTIGTEVSYLRDWVAHPQFDDYWARSSIRGRTKDIAVPIYVTGGWYDLFAKSVFDHVNAVKTVSRWEHTRNHQHVLIGPWTHGISRNGQVGGLDFGKASVVDVHPDEHPFNLCDGIIRARYRESRDKPTLIEPGKVYRYEIDLWVTSNVFLPGHRIRVEISSSNFSRFDRNPNTGHAFGTDAELQKATQRVFHDTKRASHILLPVIP